MKTNEHLRPLFDNPRDLHVFFRVQELLARENVPQRVASILRKERMIALQKREVGSGASWQAMLFGASSARNRPAIRKSLR